MLININYTVCPGKTKSGEKLKRKRGVILEKLG
jgi:hypothetical protein